MSRRTSSGSKSGKNLKVNGAVSSAPRSGGGQKMSRPSAADINRGNQLNPDHRAYHQSRGLPDLPRLP